MLKTRVKTVVVLNILIIPLVIFSYIPYLMNTAVALLSIAAVYEIYSVTDRLEKDEISFAVSCMAAVALCFVPIPEKAKILAAFLALAVLFFVIVMIKKCRFNFGSPIAVFALCLMIPLFLSSISDIRGLGLGVYCVFMMIINSIVTEMGGYFVGRKLGKHKFAPTVSPNKSVEGSLGGIFACLIIINALAAAVSAIVGFSVDWLKLEIYIVLCSVVGQLGDLAMSSVKRSVGVKDFGTCLPGHGGVLDRFDGQLFAAPFTYAFISLVGKIIY